MRVPKIFWNYFTFFSAAVISVLVATGAVNFIEKTSLDQIKKELMVASADKVGENYQEAIQYPSLNIRGLQSGWVRKEVRTIVPDMAIAEIDVRLVKESNPERLLN